MPRSWRKEGEEPSKWPRMYLDHGPTFSKHAVALGCGHDALFTDAAPKVGSTVYCARCRDYARVTSGGG
jgi:hypothetical protein